MINIERWLPSKTYSDYEISSEGKVRNIKTGRVLKTNINTRGYEQVCLRKDKKQYTTRVHKLVADTFYDGDHSGYDVNHIDGNKLNNRISNLEICTRKENIHHAYETGLKEQPKRTRVRIVETGQEYESVVECSRAINGDRGQIHRCLSGKEQTCKGYHIERVVTPNTTNE